MNTEFKVAMLEGQGGKPSTWLADFCHKKAISENDRNHHELECLCQIIEDAGEFDQVNLGGLLCLETACRRIAAMAEALAKGPSQANWSQAHEIYGRDKSDSMLSLERWAEASRTVRAKLELELLRSKAAKGSMGYSSAEANL